jgi:hypothetical protein
MKDNKKIVDSIFKLQTFIDAARPSPDEFGFSWFTHPSGAADGARLGINSDAGTIKVVTWLESYHNGDPYGTVETVYNVDSDEAKTFLKMTESLLMKDARKRARRIVEQKRDNEVERLIDDLINKIV